MSNVDIMYVLKQDIVVNLHPWNLKVRNDLNKWYLILYNTYGMIPSCVVYLALFL